MSITNSLDPFRRPFVAGMPDLNMSTVMFNILSARHDTQAAQAMIKTAAGRWLGW